MKYKIHEFKQQSDEWFQIRKQKMSASHAQAIAAGGKGLETYIYELMSEFYSSGEKEGYTNSDIQRGNELEGEARGLYCLDRGVDVKEVGFLEVDENLGCSPDGLVGDDGLIEIKCPNDKVYLKLLCDGKIDTAYIWQAQMQMYITDRKWNDLLFYNPNFKKCLQIFRQVPDSNSYQKIQDGIIKGREMIKNIKQKISQYET